MPGLSTTVCGHQWVCQSHQRTDVSHTHTHHTNTTQRTNARRGQPASRHVTTLPEDTLNQGQQLVHTPVLVGPRTLGERWSRRMRAQKNLRTLPPFARATNNTTQGTRTHVRKGNVRLQKPAVVITTTLLNAFSPQSRNVARSVRERSAWKGSARTHTHSLCFALITHTSFAFFSLLFCSSCHWPTRGKPAGQMLTTHRRLYLKELSGCVSANLEG